jgi:dolichol kinase
LYPVAGVLNTAVSAFLDEKDAAGVALTPIYLLVGCSLPIWLHPTPCDITDSAGFNLFYLLAGILSVGVGDTAAGIIGSSFGNHKWPRKYLLVI